MASLLLRPLARPGVLGLGLGLSLSTLHFAQRRQPLRLDSSPVFSGDSYRSDAKVPVLREGHLNPAAVRQISSGSIIGLCAGLALSTFSKPLVLIIGLMVVGAQWASSYGISILPYDKIQRYVTNVDLRSAVQDNMAFKLAFGSTFALAAFMKF